MFWSIVTKYCNMYNITVINELHEDINIDELNVQIEEVEYAKYMSVQDINKLIDNNEMLESHGIMFKELLDRLSKKL